MNKLLTNKLLQQGKIQTQGTPNELNRSGIDFASLIGSNDDEETIEGGRRRSRTCSRTSTTRSISVTSLASSISDVFTEVDEEEEENRATEMESSSKGQVQGSVLMNYFKSGAHWSIIGGLFFLFLIVQIVASLVDYWVSFWTHQEEIRSFNAKHNISMIVDQNETFNANNEMPIEMSLLSTDACIIINSILMLGLFVFAIIRSFGFFTVAIKASQRLHDVMFNGIISTSMRFYDTNPSGRILNRFSKDMGAIDEFLPKAILDATQIILNMVGSIVVASIVNPLFLIPVAVLGLLFAFIRKIYLKTSKNIKRLEGISEYFSI